VFIVPAAPRDTLPPAISLARLRVMDMPAVEMWDAQKLEGEITMVVAGRFVVALEGTKTDSLETIHGLLRALDVKALAALK
jgi:hypothetical protein